MAHPLRHVTLREPIETSAAALPEHIREIVLSLASHSGLRVRKRGDVGIQKLTVETSGGTGSEASGA
ncbi:hypothetical protein VM1G_11910 [Cytospora mali]|uniref:Uncharacterized protein n=1 Tax=Cytospora mali TaxID=578113 RepID=A0A194WB22_CYTMA|nr:hypothetical protein VM1G_11910 [Valsa mali]